MTRATLVIVGVAAVGVIAAAGALYLARPHEDAAGHSVDWYLAHPIERASARRACVDGHAPATDRDCGNVLRADHAAAAKLLEDGIGPEFRDRPGPAGAPPRKPD